MLGSDEIVCACLIRRKRQQRQQRWCFVWNASSSTSDELRGRLLAHLTCLASLLLVIYTYTHMHACMHRCAHRCRRDNSSSRLTSCMRITAKSSTRM